MKLGNLKRTGALYVAGVLVVHALVLWNARDLIRKGYPDFTIYYTAGTILRQGAGRELYDNGKQFEVQRQFAPQVATRLGALPFNHPPFEALLFLPLTWLSYQEAYLVWMLANLVTLAAFPIVLRPYVPVLTTWPAPFWTMLSLAFFPIFFALLQGQDAILLMFLYALTFVALKRERLATAGAWLACGLFKFHLVLPFLLLLLIQQRTFQQRKRTLFGFVAVGGVLGVVSLAAVGLRQMMAYPHYVLTLEKTMAQGAIMPSDMPNLRGAIYLFASKMPFFDLLAVTLSAVLFLVAAWILRSQLSPQDDDEEVDGLKFALAVFATVLVSYHGLGYDLCILALPILLLVGSLKGGSSGNHWSRLTILTGVGVLLFAPLQLVLLMRYNHLAFLGWAVLLCFVGLAGELRSRSREFTAQKLIQD